MDTMHQTTTQMKKELQKHPAVESTLRAVSFSALLACSLAFLPSYSSANDTEISDQLLNNRGFESSTNTSNSAPNWTVKGNTYICNSCGPWGGNAVKTDKVGGTVSQEIDLFGIMSQDQVQAGFDLTYGADVYSHTSNATVPACADTTGDCRDSFSISVTINDSAGNELIKFENSYDDITFTGWRTSTYDSFTSTVPANSYTSAIATMALYGRDMGFTGTGYGGPRFDNAHLRATYSTQAALDAIAAETETALALVQTAVDDAVSAATDVATTEVASLEIQITDPIANEVQSFSVELPATATMDTNMDMSAPVEVTVEVAPIELPSFDAPTGGTMEVAQTEVATVEMEMDNASGDIQVSASTDSGPSTSESADAQPEPASDAGPGEQTSEAGGGESSEGGGESEGTDTQSDGQSEETAETESQDGNGEVRESAGGKSDSGGKSKPKSVKQVKKEAKQKVARKIVKSMGDKGRYDATNQLRTLAVIGALGNTKSFFSSQAQIPDVANFFQSTQVPDAQITDNNAAAYYMIAGSSEAMNRLIDSQYKDKE